MRCLEVKYCLDIRVTELQYFRVLSGAYCMYSNFLCLVNFTFVFACVSKSALDEGLQYIY